MNRTYRHAARRATVGRVEELEGRRLMTAGEFLSFMGPVARPVHMEIQQFSWNVAPPVAGHALTVKGFTVEVRGGTSGLNALLKAAESGRGLGAVEVDFVNASGTAPKSESLEYDFRGVKVTSISMSTPSDESPVETISFSYTGMNIAYKP